MNFLPLFDKGVVLCDSAEGQFFHEIDLVWRFHVLVFERLDNHWESSTEQHYLTILWMECKQLLNDRREFG